MDNVIIEAPQIPDSTDIEISILAGIMKTPYLYGIASRTLKDEMFSNGRTRGVWRQYHDMDAKRQLTSTTEVYHKVGQETLRQMVLCTETPDTDTAMIRACNLLKEVAIKRVAYMASIELMKKAVDPASSVDDILAFPETADKQFREWESDDAKTMTITDAIAALGDEIQATQVARDKGEYVRIPTSIKTLDYLTYSGWKGGNLVIVAARPSVGKSQPVDTKVLTPSGYVRMGDIKTGDKVIGRNGKEQTVLGVYPQGVRPTYRVTMNDGSSVLCDEEHIWTVTDVTSTRKVEQDMTLREMLRRGLLASLTPNRAKTGRKPVSKYRIPLVSPVEFEERDLPIHPYLLGLLIGDGCMTGTTAFISTPDMDAEIIERATKCLPSGYHFRKRLDTSCPQYIILQDITIRGNGFVKKTEELGLNVRSGRKFIPADYLLGSVDQRLDLLRGLMDTDGSVSEEGYPSFYTTSRQLANDVMDLVRSLGGMAHVSVSDRTNEGKAIEYKVAVSMEICPFSLGRKAERWHPVQKSRFITSAERVEDTECVCIYVSNEDHLYVTENYIVTHNTAIMLQMARVAAEHGCPALIFNLEMTNTELAQRYVTSTGIMNQADIAEGKVKWQDFEAATATFSRLGLFMNDSCRYIESIIPKIDLMVKKHGVRAVFIDYLQLIECASVKGKGGNQERIEFITRRLKEAAKDFNVPIILLSQLNRGSAAERRAPQLYDLRDSGSIEQDADIVLMLDRASDSAGRYKDDEIDMWVRKNRQGKGGNVCINLKAYDCYTVFAEHDSLNDVSNTPMDLPQNTEDDNEPF